MTDKNHSIMSKGWLIIGIVLLCAGVYFIFLANSFFYESDLIRSSISNTENYQVIKDSANHISVNTLSLTIISLIIIAIGIIMCIEWILFSKFLKSHMSE